MGLVEVIGILIFAIIFNIWYFAFYRNRKGGDPDAHKKGFIAGGKFHKFSREDLSDEERAKEMVNVISDEFFGGEEKDQRVK